MSETLCTGCGATVTQDSELYWRDSGGYKSCSPATGSTGLHRIEEELPPVAIKPEAPQEVTVAALTAYMEEQKAILMRDIEAIYPLLGTQAYRHRGSKEVPWAIEQHLSNIASKDAEIQRIQNLLDCIIREVDNMKRKLEADCPAVQA